MAKKQNETKPVQSYFETIKISKYFFILRMQSLRALRSLR